MSWKVFFFSTFFVLDPIDLHCIDKDIFKTNCVPPQEKRVNSRWTIPLIKKHPYLELFVNTEWTYIVSQASQIFTHWYVKAYDFDITLTALMVASLTNFLTVKATISWQQTLSLTLSFPISLVLCHSSLIYSYFVGWFLWTPEMWQRRGFKKNPPARFCWLSATFF